MPKRYALDDIVNERIRQTHTWGVQNHNDAVWLAILTEEVGESAQAVLHDLFVGKAAGTLREELVHVAAVATGWIECIDRRVDEDTPLEAGVAGQVEFAPPDPEWRARHDGGPVVHRQEIFDAPFEDI